MDFATRDEYRHVLERLAAQPALRGRRGAGGGRTGARRGRAGRWRSARGARRLLPRRPGIGRARAPVARTATTGSVARRRGEATLWLYLGAITMLTVAFAGGWLRTRLEPRARVAARRLRDHRDVRRGQLAVQLVNLMATIVAVLRTLPWLDFRDGIPAEARTPVVVPTPLATDPASTTCWRRSNPPPGESRPAPPLGCSLTSSTRRRMRPPTRRC